MDQRTGVPVFFDIGNTLAAVRISASGATIESLDVFPDVPDVLDELRSRGARLGIISDRGPIPAADVNRALQEAGLAEQFEPELVVYGRKDSPAVFEEAARRAGPANRLIYVGEDPAERAQAIQAGFEAVPHPRLAPAVLDGPEPLQFARITAPPQQPGASWTDELHDLPVLTVHVTGPAGATRYAVATTSALTRLDDLGLRVDRLGAADEPLTSELYLLRDDRQEDSGFLTPDGNSAAFFATGPTGTEPAGGGRATPGVLASTDEGLLVAVPAGRSVESYHFPGARHGHNLKLGPLPVSIDHPSTGDGPLAMTLAEPGPSTVSAAELDLLEATVGPQALADHVARYAGARPLDSSGAMIISRHIQHPDNAVAVTALVADLERVGSGRFAVRRHRFTHEGRTLENVEAEFPGTGLAGIVVIGAHLDSTGAREPGYRPVQDRAPGADDDASGIAGVLLAAEAIAALDDALQVPRRTVRFVLFNAEEHGLVGSLAYAREQAQLGMSIVAALQLDMIGYDVRPDSTFELHAGFSPAPAIEGRSLELAQLVAGLHPQVTPKLPPPQIFPAPGEPDPAERRSDHYSFQLGGYPACLVSEDLFAGPGPLAPPEEMNPMYHLPSDTVVNAPYAADIARLVIAAAWVAATR